MILRKELQYRSIWVYITPG